MIADKVNMNQETVRLILTEELGMRKICAKMVPRNLTEQQWDARISVRPYLLKQSEANPMLMGQVIFGDESWFFQYDPETKCQKFRMAFRGITKVKESTHFQFKGEVLAYTGCPRRNVPDFGRVFLMLNYTDITQNTYIQS